MCEPACQAYETQFSRKTLCFFSGGHMTALEKKRTQSQKNYFRDTAKIKNMNFFRKK